MADPTFSRIEIKLATKADLARARLELLELAADLRKIHDGEWTDDDALILSRHRIKQTSQKLRMGIDNAD